MPDEKIKPTSTARVNAYKKRTGGRTITVHLSDTYAHKLYNFTRLVGGQKEAITTAIMALDAILKNSKNPEADAQTVRNGELPDRLKVWRGKGCKQQPKAEPDCLAELLDDEAFNRIIATLSVHMPALAEKLVKERASSRPTPPKSQL